MTRRSRPDASTDALSAAINAYMCRRQAEQLPGPERRGRLPRRNGSGRPAQAIAALSILTVASFVLFLVV